MVNYVILLPPSEGKISGGTENRGKLSFSTLDKYREGVYYITDNFLKGAMNEDVEKLVGLKGEKALAARDSMLRLSEGPFMKAIERYSGVMFKAIEYSLMEEYLKTNFNSSAIFVDGLYGLVTPIDLISDYKIKISSKIGDFDVSRFWKGKLKGHYGEIFEDRTVIDILPEAHRKVVDFGQCVNYYRIFFGRVRNDKLVSEGHLSKKLKGEFVNYLVSFENIGLEDLKAFSHTDGFSYSEEYSGKNLIVYLKD